MVAANENEKNAAVASEATGSANGSTEEMVNQAGSQASAELPADIPADALIAQMQVEIEDERARYAELYDRFQRASAEFQNSRRRQEKQIAEEIERASVHIVRKILPVLDDFELAFQNVPATASEEELAWVDGFRQIQRKLLNVLAEEGVTPMPVDGPFDPSRHEAIAGEASDDVESGHIISTLRIGYEQSGRVIRPALVRVAQ